MSKSGKIIIGLLGLSTITAGVINFNKEKEITELKSKILEKNEIEKQNEKKHSEITNEITRVNETNKLVNEKSMDIKSENEYLIGLFNQMNSQSVTVDQLKSIPSKHGSPLPSQPLHFDLLSIGIPSTQNLWFYESYISSANLERRVPNWVMQRISIEDFKNKVADRKHSFFNNNTISIPDQFKADNKDYFGSGWSKGHMVPAGDNVRSQEAMDQTFLLNTNIVPQDLSNNSGFWYRLESLCKNELAKKFKYVTVISGPVYTYPQTIEIISEADLPKRPRYSKQTQKKFVKYEVIGDRNVAVPNYLFKIILAESSIPDEPLLLGSFLIPNEPIPHDALLTDYQVPLHNIEISTGLQFFRKLNFQTDIKSLCDSDPSNCSVMTEKMLLPRLIGFCRTPRDISDLQNQNKHIEWDENLNQLLNSKINEINEIESLKKQKQVQIINNLPNINK